MKIIVAPDSFKGSLTQVEVAKVMKKAIEEIDPTTQVVMKPMADGGEGTLDALLGASSEGFQLPINVIGPLGEKIKTYIGIVNSDTAVIEVATIAGLPIVPENLLNPYKTTTYGIGEAIRVGLDEGIRKFVIGLGGSATNDGGFGMLLALGATIKDDKGKSVGILGYELKNIASIDLSTLDPRIAISDIQAASDVDNPLCGKNGASAVFGPQKGATTGQIRILDEALKEFSNLLLKTNSLPGSMADQPGAGAAGGLGFAFMAIGGKLVSGAKLVAETIGLEQEIMHAGLVITGEGKSDEQTLYGKAPGYVAKLAGKYNVPIILISGSISDKENVLSMYFTEINSIINPVITLKRAIEEAEMLLLNRTKEVILRRKNTMIKEIYTENSPAAIGPYSQAIQAGDFIYVSGQIGVDPKTGEAVEGIENQTKQVLENLQAILTEAGASFSQVVKFTIFLNSMDDFATVNEIYGSYLKKPYPARATVEVSRLPKDLLVEMDVVVYLK